MICFRDMTFCTATDCGNADCHRRFDAEQKDRAEKWWAGFGKLAEEEGPPVAFSDFKDTDYCPGYMKEVN